LLAKTGVIMHYNELHPMLWNKLKLMRGCRLALTTCILCFQASLLLAAAPPPNDLCAGAEVIPGAGPFPYRTQLIPDISGATTAGDPVLPVSNTNCYQIVSRGVWYKFTPAAAGAYLLSVNDTAATVADTFMAVYTSAGRCSGPFVLFALQDYAGFTQ